MSVQRTSVQRLLSTAVLGLALMGAVTACGNQTPGGTQVSGAGASVAGAQMTASAGGSAKAQGETDPKATSPIVVKIGNDEYRTIMAIYHKYDSVKGGPLNLQQPKAAAVEVPGGGTMQEFVTGNIYWSKATGAHIVRGQILKTYLDNGGPSGKLGYPIGDETTDGNVTFSAFQHGKIQLKDQAIQVIEDK